jgi:hypothetical protein
MNAKNIYVSLLCTWTKQRTPISMSYCGTAITESYASKKFVKYILRNTGD